MRNPARRGLLAARSFRPGGLTLPEGRPNFLREFSLALVVRQGTPAIPAMLRRHAQRWHPPWPKRDSAGGCWGHCWGSSPWVDSLLVGDGRLRFLVGESPLMGCAFGGPRRAFWLVAEDLLPRLAARCGESPSMGGPIAAGPSKCNTCRSSVGLVIGMPGLPAGRRDFTSHTSTFSQVRIRKRQPTAKVGQVDR